MSDDNRKPIIIAAVCAGIAVLVLVFGIGFGRGGSADSSWQSNLSGFDVAAPLTTADLELIAGSCTVGDREIIIPAQCSFRIPEFGGTFELGAITKKTDATLVAPTGAALGIEMLIEGTSVSHTVEVNKPVGLTVGRSGGALTLVCGSGLGGPCLVTLG
jgi:hypothetical protein